jgi:hypothetical protein
MILGLMHKQLCISLVCPDIPARLQSVCVPYHAGGQIFVSLINTET